MKLSELLDNRLRLPHDKLELYILVEQKGVGCRPAVKVDRVQEGFDWESGRLIIYPEVPLCKSSYETQETIDKLLEKINWLVYENSALKREINKLRKPKIYQD